MVLALAGCATGGGKTSSAPASKGMSDEDGIRTALENWRAGMESKNIEKIGAGMSDKFNHSEWGNKTQMLDFMKSQFEQGTLDNAKIDASKAKTKIENGVATVYPVELTTTSINATIEFKLQKEADGVWRTISINVEGV